MVFVQVVIIDVNGATSWFYWTDTGKFQSRQMWIIYTKYCPTLTNKKKKYINYALKENFVKSFQQ